MGCDKTLLNLWLSNSFGLTRIRQFISKYVLICYSYSISGDFAVFP